MPHDMNELLRAAARPEPITSRNFREAAKGGETPAIEPKYDMNELLRRAVGEDAGAALERYSAAFAPGGSATSGSADGGQVGSSSLARKPSTGKVMNALLHEHFAARRYGRPVDDRLWIEDEK